MKTQPCGLQVHQVRLVTYGGVRLVLALTRPAPRAGCPSTRDQRVLRRLRIFGQQDGLRADRSKGRETWA
jgi:hypothetical protein